MKRPAFVLAPLALCCLISSCVFAPGFQHRRYTGSDDYERPQSQHFDTTAVRGWRVYLDSRISSDDIVSRTMRDLLDQQLGRLESLLPSAAVTQLRSVPIYVNFDVHDSNGSAARYHPDSSWLRKNNLDVAMYHGIEILDGTDYPRVAFLQPNLLIHEFSHAYSDLILPQNAHEEIRTAYFAAMGSHVYDSVADRHAKRGRAYAMKNENEYFAESSVAYFDTNHSYPFTRSDLRHSDPKIETLLTQLWYSSASFNDSLEYRDSVVNNWHFHISKSVARSLADSVIWRFVSTAHAFDVAPDSVTRAMHDVPIYVYGHHTWDDSSYVIRYSRFATLLRAMPRSEGPDRGIEIGRPDRFISPAFDAPILLQLGSAYLQRYANARSEPYQEALKNAVTANLYGLSGTGVIAGPADWYYDLLTKPYFNASDKYPHNRQELHKYDPKGYALMHDIFRLPD